MLFWVSIIFFPIIFFLGNQTSISKRKFCVYTLRRWHNVRKSTTDDEADGSIEASDSSKLVDGLDLNPSGPGFWERTDTSLGVGASVKKRVLEKVRLEKQKEERVRRHRLNWAAQWLGELTAMFSLKVFLVYFYLIFCFVVKHYLLFRYLINFYPTGQPASIGFFWQR